jgi:2'-hydroxyisoflavone reductase
MSTALPAQDPAAAPDDAEPPAKLKVLFLGGTGFIGPHIVRALLDHGHEVTLFNRGNRAELFPDLELIEGNRIVDEEPGLAPLAAAIESGRRWDVVIDTSNVHTWTENSAALLKDAASHYVFTSSLSVYADNSVIDQTEDGKLESMPDEEAAKIDRLPYNMQYFGAVKVRCEAAAERHFPGRTTIVRPGLIVGPRDFSNRFTYWPWRVRQGGAVLAPGDPADPVMIIDVRDLAAFLVKLIEDRTYGIFNANGPASGDMTIGAMLDACRRATESDATFTWASAEFLAEHEVGPWMDMPVWVPPADGMEGFHRKSMARALAAGLTTRPIDETIIDTLTWLDDEYIPSLAERDRAYEPGVSAPGITREREAELLEELKAKPEGN